MKNFVLASCFMGLIACGDDGSGPGADTSAPTDTSVPVEDTSAPTDGDTSAPTDGDTNQSDTVTEVNPLIGRVYAQKLGVGVASYHFVAADDVYLDYETALGWRMDNGALFPARKAFTDLTFDIPNRTFYATIDWGTPEGTTVNSGERVWLYTMVFSGDYSAIISGQIEALDAEGNTLKEYIFGFGRDLAYREVTPEDPFPFALLVSCLSRPLDLTKVVFAMISRDATCATVQDILAFPLEGSDLCCDVPNGLESWANFSCDAQSGTFSADYAAGACASDPTRTTEQTSATCTQSVVDPTLYSRIVGGGCGP
jgi:hypothetical protein